MLRKFRLIYFPGLVSLVGLLVISFLSIKKILPKPMSVIPYFAPKDTRPDDWSISFSKYLILDELKQKRKTYITLDADKITNQKKLSLIRYEAQKLKYAGDSSAVVLITLTDDITYGEFISLLDICLMDNHEQFAAFDDKFVIFGGPRPVKKKKNYSAPFINSLIFFRKPSLTGHTGIRT